VDLVEHVEVGLAQGVELRVVELVGVVDEEPVGVAMVNRLNTMRSVARTPASRRRSIGAERRRSDSTTKVAAAAMRAPTVARPAVL
jgi:hypothetical protein